MLLAAALVAMLMAAVLALLGGVNRDVRTMRHASQHDPGAQAAADLLGRDLLNAPERFSVGPADRQRRDDRRQRRYRPRYARTGWTSGARDLPRRPGWALRREQSYLDDPDRPQRWESLAAVGVSELSVARNGGASSRLRVTLGTTRGETIVRDVRMQ